MVRRGGGDGGGGGDDDDDEEEEEEEGEEVEPHALERSLMAKFTGKSQQQRAWR
jgi:hypothetical protein